MKGQYKERTITCKGCGKSVTKRMPKKIQYCSKKCYDGGERPERRTGKNVPCPVCGVLTYKAKSRCSTGKNFFCSRQHFLEWWGSGKDVFACKICNKEFKWSPSRKLNNNVTYCSLACRDKDPERKKMLLEMNSKQQQLKITSIEKIGYQILDDLGVDYVRQFVVNDKFCVDAFVPLCHTIIQFDGDYWHANPLKFKKSDSRQAKRVRLDNSQDRYMNKCGYTVIRIWESTIKKEPGKVKDLLREMLIRKQHTLFPLESGHFVV